VRGVDLHQAGAEQLDGPQRHRPLATRGAGLHGWLASRVAAEIFTIVPLTAAYDQGSAGSSSSRVTLFGTGARIALARPAATWVPTIGAGVILAWMHTDGSGTPPLYVGRSLDAVSGGPFLRPGLGVALGSRLHLRADALAGVALRRFVVAYAGRESAAWGRPFLGGTLGLEVTLP
jgi:hypothetical protein